MSFYARADCSWHHAHIPAKVEAFRHRMLFSAFHVSVSAEESFKRNETRYLDYRDHGRAVQSPEVDSSLFVGQRNQLIDQSK